MNPDEKPLMLVQDVKTRWNSTFHMLERLVTNVANHYVVFLRFFKLKEALVPLLTNEEWSKKINFSLTMGDWNNMGKVVKVLQVIREWARVFD